MVNVLFVRLSLLGKLGQNLQCVSELSLGSDRRVARQTFANKASGKAE